MPTLGEFFFGLGLFASGALTIVYARKIVDYFGFSETFEHYFGSGGTYTGIRLVGVLAILTGLLLMVGKLDDVLINFWKSIGG